MKLRIPSLSHNTKWCTWLTPDNVKGLVLIMQSSPRMCYGFAATMKKFAVKRHAMSKGRLISGAQYWTKLTALFMPPLGRGQLWDCQPILSRESPSMFFSPLAAYICLVNYLYNVIFSGHQCFCFVSPLQIYFFVLGIRCAQYGGTINWLYSGQSVHIFPVWE